MEAVLVMLFALADVSASSNRSMAKGYLPPQLNKNTPVLNVTQEDKINSPDSIDWSTSGATTAIKNQGTCGCCWAFAVASAIESAVYMAGGSLPVLSSGQVCRCDDKDS